ncbi:transposase, Ptta/En/Spm [Tanacetum coccineum]
MTTEGGKPLAMNLKSSTDHRTRDMVHRQYHTRLGGLDDVNGSNTKGYFVWSFMDLFELLDGYNTGYGLYYVDLDDKDLTRYPKFSAHMVGAISQEAAGSTTEAASGSASVGQPSQQEPFLTAYLIVLNDEKLSSKDVWVEAENKKRNRSKSDEPHIKGSKSFARLCDEETQKNNGVPPSCEGMYCLTHTYQDGSIVNATAAKVVEAIKNMGESSTAQETRTDGSPYWIDDDLAKIKGPERGGNVRCVGKFPAAKKRRVQDPQVPLLKAQVKGLWEDFMSLVEAENKKRNRSKSDEPHIKGSKSFARLCDEETQKNNGVPPSCEGMYCLTHTYQDGSIVNATAAKVVEAIKTMGEFSTAQETRTDGSPYWIDDDLAKVKGPERGGNVCCVGKFPATKKRRVQDPQVPLLKAQVKGLREDFMSLVAAVKEHIPGLNLSTIPSRANTNMENPRSTSASHHPKNSTSTATSAHPKISRSTATSPHGTSSHPKNPTSGTRPKNPEKSSENTQHRRKVADAADSPGKLAADSSEKVAAAFILEVWSKLNKMPLKWTPLGLAIALA